MNGFKKCQFCQFESNDICEFRMWQECDAQDKPIPDKMLITCKGEACFQKIDADARLFIEVPWGQGGPGKFMLICGDCPHRQNYSCRHPKLKANGGTGLEVKFSNFPVLNAIICTTDGRATRLGNPATICEGNLK